MCCRANKLLEHHILGALVCAGRWLAAVVFVGEKLLRVHVKPTAVLAYKAACFVQAVGASRQAVACDKFDASMVVIANAVVFYLQAQPFDARRVGFKRGWAGAGMPGL